MANRTVTVKSSGGDYTSLEAAFTQEVIDHADLVAEAMILTFECHNFQDVHAHQPTGWTTSADYYVNIVAADDHGGKWSTSAYRIVDSDADGQLVITEPYTRVTGIQVATTNTYRRGIHANSVQGPFYISKCIVDGPSETSTNGSIGIRINNHNSTVANIWNNIIYRWNEGIQYATVASAVWNVYSNTVCLGAGTGISARYINTARLRNNIVQGFGTDYNTTDNTTLISSNNISEDASSPDVAYRTLTVSFVAEGTDDFHLAAGDTAAQNAGGDLSADANLPFSDDIDSETRVAPWDIGADQIVSAATNRRRRVLIAGHRG